MLSKSYRPQMTKGTENKAYTYDINNNRKSFTLTVNGTKQMSQGYSYDNMDRLTTVKENNNTIASYTYNRNGTLATKTQGSLSVTYGYSPGNFITSLINKTGSTTISNFTYNYNIDGTQASKTDSIDGLTTQFTYDSSARLTREQNNNETISYTYDNFSNRETLTKTGVDPQTIRYIYDKNNRLIREQKDIPGESQIIEYGYDANGNQIAILNSSIKSKSGGIESVTLELPENSNSIVNEYDAFNRLTASIGNGTTSNYTYDGNNLRRTKTINGSKTTHIWDGMNIVAEQTASGTITSKYYRGLDLISRTESGTTQNYVHNGHGDVVQMLQGSNVTKTYNYNAFGVEKNPVAGDTNPFRYCGEYLDLSSGMYYLRARYYTPGNGRFITEDPIRDGLNWYAYANNNPIKFIDPSGLYSLEFSEDGRVYAIIESGDSLSKIAKSEVNDSGAYTKMKGVTDFNKINVGQRVDITDIYGKSYPNPNPNASSSMGVGIVYANVPPEGSGYVAPKKGPAWDSGKKGWKDKHGNVWVPDKSGHGGEHWDVQYPNGGYDNVYGDGTVRAGKGGRGRFSPAETQISPPYEGNYNEVYDYGSGLYFFPIAPYAPIPAPVPMPIPIFP